VGCADALDDGRRRSLLLAGSEAWPYFGFVGGAVYVYFAGRGILARVTMQRRGLRIGKPTNVKLAYALLAIWGVMGGATLFAAVVNLGGS